MYFEFTRTFADKWSLIFLITLPLIEIMRTALAFCGTDKVMRTFTARIYAKTTSRIKQNMLSAFTGTVGSKLSNLFCRQQRSSSLEDSAILPLIDRSAYNSKLPTTQKRASPVNSSSKLNLNSLNTYDLLKIFSTLAMFVDHYSYFGLPGPDWQQSRWMRVIGRASAPGFFFLAGYSSNRFRMRLYLATVFLYTFISVVPLGFVHSPWESIMNVLLINSLFCYLPPHACWNPLVHAVMFALLQHLRHTASVQLNIGYGTQSFMFAVVGDLVRHKHWLWLPWLIAAMTSFASSSVDVFAATELQHNVIIAECVLNALFFVFFVRYGIKEIPILNEHWMTQQLRDGLKTMSRAGLSVYFGHLLLFGLIQAKVGSGALNRLRFGITS